MAEVPIVVQAHLRKPPDHRSCHAVHMPNSCFVSNLTSTFARLVQFSHDGTLQSLIPIDPAMQAGVWTNLDGFAAVVMGPDSDRIPAHDAIRSEQRIYLHDQLDYEIKDERFCNDASGLFYWSTLSTPANDSLAPTVAASQQAQRIHSIPPPCIEERLPVFWQLAQELRDRECAVTNELQRDRVVIRQYKHKADPKPLSHIIQPRSHVIVSIQGGDATNTAFSTIKRFNADEDGASNDPRHIPQESAIRLRPGKHYVVRESTFDPPPHRSLSRASKYFWGVPWGLPLV